MRSAVGGWVVKRLANWTLRPVSGLTMYFWACTGSTFMGMAFTLASIFSSARASGSPSVEQAGAAAIGLELTTAAQCHLEQAGRKGGEQ